ncbi:MAG: hypothetical protein ACLT98_14360 [Eggerthellaceae bacterium]
MLGDIEPLSAVDRLEALSAAAAHQHTHIIETLARELSVSPRRPKPQSRSSTAEHRSFHRAIAKPPAAWTTCLCALDERLAYNLDPQSRGHRRVSKRKAS